MLFQPKQLLLARNGFFSSSSQNFSRLKLEAIGSCYHTNYYVFHDVETTAINTFGDLDLLINHFS